jgi:hypothetical protein
MLGVLLHAPRCPFYSPKATRSRWVHSRKAILAFCRLAHRTVRCATGHCPMRISFLIWRSPPLALWSRWRTGQSGAPFRPLARPRVSRGSRDRPLALPTVGPPDSPVNYIRTLLITSREQQVRLSQPGAPNTVRCTTGHCLVHPDRADFSWTKSSLISTWFFLLPALRHNTLVSKTMY